MFFRFGLSLSALPALFMIAQANAIIIALVRGNPLWAIYVGLVISTVSGPGFTPCATIPLTWSSSIFLK